jgi:hypothetical protein
VYGKIILTIPKVGITNTYTSGCPKNQNKCCDKIGSPPYAKSKKVVCQCLSNAIIIIAAAKTGVIIANILKVKKILIEINGNNILLCRIPGILKVLRVINKFTNETVELIPTKTTPNSNKSCAPKPVYFVLDEKGVINVHPATVKVLFEHFT